MSYEKLTDSRPRRAIAGDQDERILNERRRHKDLPYDLYPVSNATIADLSQVLFETEYLPKSFAPDIWRPIIEHTKNA